MNRRDFIKGFIAATTVVALAPLAPITEVPLNSVTHTYTFDSLITTTLKNYRAALADNITSKNAVWFYLKEKKLITEIA